MHGIGHVEAVDGHASLAIVEATRQFHYFGWTYLYTTHNTRGSFGASTPASAAAMISSSYNEGVRR